MNAAAPLPPIPPTLLAGRRVAVLGSGGGLGLALASAAAAAGAEVTGIDPRPRFDHLTALIRADLSDPAALDAAAAALPDGLDALVLLPDLSVAADPAAVLAHGAIAPIRLARALAPRLPPGAAIVVRAAPDTADRPARLAAIRAARSLAPADLAGFVARWGLDAEPARAPQLAGWAMAAWALARVADFPRLRINAIVPAAPDGRLPPALAAAAGLAESDGATIAARAALCLISPLSPGLTGAAIAADGGLSARTQADREGL